MLDNFKKQMDLLKSSLEQKEKAFESLISNIKDDNLKKTLINVSNLTKKAVSLQDEKLASKTLDDLKKIQDNWQQQQ